MEGNNFTRVLRLLKHLSFNPRHIAKYVTYTLLNKKEPLEVGLPWISWGAIEFLDNKYRFKEDMEVLELGGGGSTVYFARKGANLTCLESSDIWSDKLKRRIKELNLKNIDLKILPYDCTSKSSFMESDFFKAIGAKKYDVIFVDNYEETLQIRPDCFYEAEKSIKPGGIIILDDSWRYLDVRVKNSAKNFKVFKSIGPCRYGVTTTDIYFY